jgi:hypothetical protein
MATAPSIPAANNAETKIFLMNMFYLLKSHPNELQRHGDLTAIGRTPR